MSNQVWAPLFTHSCPSRSNLSWQQFQSFLVLMMNSQPKYTLSRSLTIQNTLYSITWNKRIQLLLEHRAMKYFGLHGITLLHVNPQCEYCNCVKFHQLRSSVKEELCLLDIWTDRGWFLSSHQKVLFAGSTVALRVLIWFC